MESKGDICRPTFHCSSCSKFLLAVQISLNLIPEYTTHLEESKMHTLPKFVSKEAARSQTEHLQYLRWWTCGHWERSSGEKWLQQQYWWHYWSHDTRLFNSQWKALKCCTSQIVIIFQTTFFQLWPLFAVYRSHPGFPLTINGESQFKNRIWQ